MPALKPLLDTLDDRRSAFLAALESITPDQLARTVQALNPDISRPSSR